MYTDKQHGYGHGSSLGQISAASAADAAAYQAKWAEHVKMERDAQTACAPAMDRGQLEGAIDQNSGALDDLERALMRLRERLSSVLQPDYPRPCGVGEAVARPPCSPAVAYLQTQRERIGSLVVAVNDIHARLDA